MSAVINLHVGWNAGARSLKWVDGDAEITFEPNPLTVTDVHAGLIATNDVSNFTAQTHGFRFSRVSAIANSAIVHERGVLKHSAGIYVSGDVFKIRRVEGIVTFWKNAALLYTSATPSVGRVFCGSAMFMGGDRF